MYADDTNLIYASDDLNEILLSINQDIETIHELLKS